MHYAAQLDMTSDSVYIYQTLKGRGGDVFLRGLGGLTAEDLLQRKHGKDLRLK